MTDDPETTVLICWAIAGFLYLVQVTAWTTASFRAGFPLARFTWEFSPSPSLSAHLTPEDGQIVIFQATPAGSWLFRRQLRGPHIVPWLRRAPYLAILAEATVDGGTSHVTARLPFSLAAALVPVVLIPWIPPINTTAPYTAWHAAAGSLVILVVLSAWIRAEVQRLPSLYREMINILGLCPQAASANPGAA